MGLKIGCESKFKPGESVHETLGCQSFVILKFLKGNGMSGSCHQSQEKETERKPVPNWECDKSYHFLFKQSVFDI